MRPWALPLTMALLGARHGARACVEYDGPWGPIEGTIERIGSQVLLAVSGGLRRHVLTDVHGVPVATLRSVRVMG